MRGIEAATWGVLSADPELKTSRNGNPFLNVSLAVTIGHDDNGKPVTQWLRVACFGETAELIAARARKGDRLYVEGSLTLNTWSDKATGETRAGLNLAAWKAEKIGAGAIGKNRPKQSASHVSPGPRAPAPLEFNDPIPF